MSDPIEAAVLRILDELAKNPKVDERWLAIGRTQIELGFMAVNRAVEMAERSALDPAAEGIPCHGRIQPLQAARVPLQKPLVKA